MIYITQKGVKDGMAKVIYPDGKVTKVSLGWGGKETVIEEPNEKMAKYFKKEKAKLTRKK